LVDDHRRRRGGCEHGVYTLLQDGRVMTVERFTDVFELRDGQWMALSAQETAT